MYDMTLCPIATEEVRR